jgi:hypothetical protein
MARARRDAHCSSSPARASSAVWISASCPCDGVRSLRGAPAGTVCDTPYRLWPSSSGDPQLAGSPMMMRGAQVKPGAVDVNKAGEIQGGVLAELDERGRLHAWPRRRGPRVERARSRRRR